MLQGIDPVIIFQFKKLSTTSFGELLTKIPVVAEAKTFIEQPPIPIYLSEQLTGLFIDTEDKNVDIDTDVETLTNGEAPAVSQKGINSSVSINLKAHKDSVGMTLLSAMIDLLFDKVTSQEYAITYLHGATTIFRGVLHNYSVSQNSDESLMRIKIELSKGQKTPQPKTTPPSLTPVTAPIPNPGA